MSHREWARVYAAPGHLAVTTSGEGPRGGAPSPGRGPVPSLVALRTPCGGFLLSSGEGLPGRGKGHSRGAAARSQGAQPCCSGRPRRPSSARILSPPQLDSFPSAFM